MRVFFLIFLCLLSIFSFGREKEVKTRKPDILVEAEALYRAKRYKESVSLWKQVARGRDERNAEIAEFRLLEVPFRLDEKPTVARVRKNLNPVQNVILKGKNEFLRAAAYVLFAEFDPGEPTLEGALGAMKSKEEKRIAFVGIYGDALRLKQLERHGSALAGFRDALTAYRSLCGGSSSGDAKTSGNAQNPFLPWNESDITARISELERILRDLDDAKLHAEGLRLYQSARYADAKKLFDRILLSFPLSAFVESSVFHAAACESFLYEPPPGKKFDSVRQEAPLLQFIEKYSAPSEERKVPSRLLGDAWNLLGDFRFFRMEGKGDPAEGWENACVFYYEISPDADTVLHETLFKLGTWLHYRRNYSKAGDIYDAILALVPTRKDDHNLPNHTASLKNRVQAQSSPVLYHQKILRNDGIPERCFFRLACATEARYFSIADRLIAQLDRMMKDHNSKKTPELMSAFLEYERGMNQRMQSNFEEALAIFTAAEKKYPKSLYAPHFAWNIAVMQAGSSRYGLLEAIRTFERLIRAYPNAEITPQTYSSLAFCYELAGNLPASARTYAELQRRFPKSSAALIAHGRLEKIQKKIKDMQPMKQDQPRKADQSEVKP